MDAGLLEDDEGLISLAVRPTLLEGMVKRDRIHMQLFAQLPQHPLKVGDRGVDIAGITMLSGE